MLVFTLAEKEKVIETVVADTNHCYEITFKSKTGEYDNYLPTVQKMIDSFRIIPASSHLDES